MSLRCSVVIPVYNKAGYIADALRSVLAQSESDLEVVVVDDGSVDGSAELVMGLADPRVRLVRQANAGVSAARNAGISLSRGDLVFFFDADDWMHPDYLRIQFEQARRHPQVAMFAARFLRFDERLHAPSDWPVLAAPACCLIDNLPAAWRRGQTFITSSVAMRRDTLLAMQPCFPVGESKGEDMDLWFRAAEAGPLCLTELPLVGYREAAFGSLSTAHADALFPPYLQRLDDRARAGRLPPGLARSSRRFVAEARTTQARVLLAQGRRAAALACLARASAAANRPRWWLTWLMALAFPGRVVDRWEQRRIRATQARL